MPTDYSKIRGVNHYLPTKRHKRLNNPSYKSKKEIISWYKRQVTILERRRLRDVDIEVEHYTQFIPDDPGIPPKISNRPERQKISLWKVSEQDYLVYKRSLDERFERFKKKYNKYIQCQKKSQSE